MQYLLMIYRAESAEPEPGTVAFDRLMADCDALARSAKARGALVGANALEMVSTATTVRVRDGRTQTLDGPFAETKEQLGGYYLLDCADLDEAIAFAAEIPAAAFGSIEIRPIRDLGREQG